MFKLHILERGIDYYESGFVEDYCGGKDFVQATVQGNSAYYIYVDAFRQLYMHHHLRKVGIKKTERYIL